METDQLVDALERCFISEYATDGKSFASEANIVDEMGRAATNLHKIAHAITPTDAAPLYTPDGGYVASLTEAVVFAANNLGKIAEAISHLADAVREGNEIKSSHLDDE